MSHIPQQPSPGAESAGVIPLAPPVVPILPTEKQRRLTTRLWCWFVFIACGFMLGVGMRLNPADQGRTAGTGVHEQMGFPPCGWLNMTGWPCPTCGCTTSVTYFAHGHPIKSFITQPFGFAVALVAALLVPLSLIGMITGRWYGPSIFWMNWYWQYWVYGSIALLVLAWLYKGIVIKMGLGV